MIPSGLTAFFPIFFLTMDAPYNGWGPLLSFSCLPSIQLTADSSGCSSNFCYVSPSISDLLDLPLTHCLQVQRFLGSQPAGPAPQILALFLAPDSQHSPHCGIQFSWNTMGVLLLPPSLSMVGSSSGYLHQLPCSITGGSTPPVFLWRSVCFLWPLEECCPHCQWCPLHRSPSAQAASRIWTSLGCRRPSALVLGYHSDSNPHFLPQQRVATSWLHFRRMV